MAIAPLSSSTPSRRGVLQTLLSLVGAGAAAGRSVGGAVGPTPLPLDLPVLDAAERLASPPAAPIAPPAAPVERIVDRGPAVLRTLLQVSPVAGFQYHLGEDVWSFLREGDGLELVREAHNRYDKRAVRVEWMGEKIGYVPVVDNAAISQLLDRDACLDAVITRLRESPDPWSRVQFAVYLTLPTSG